MPMTTLCIAFVIISKRYRIWFEESDLVLNTDKCHFMILGKYMENETFISNNLIFNNSNEEKILWITIDSKLTVKITLKFYANKPLRKKGLYQGYCII